MARKPLKQRWHEFRKPIACNCGCGKRWARNDTLQAKAHFLRHYGGYWAGQKARSMGRKIGKDADRLRRIGRAGWEAAQLRDRSGKLTAKARSRPDGPVRKIGDLQARHRHGRDHDRAEQHDRKAARHQARGRGARAARHRSRAQARRARHTERPAPVPRPVPAPRPAQAANGRSNGSRTQPSNGHTQRPLGRLAPSRPAPANGRPRT